MDLLNIYTDLIRTTQQKLDEVNRSLKNYSLVFGDQHTVSLTKTKLNTIESALIFSLIDAIQWLIESEKKVVYLDGASLHYQILCRELKQRGRTLIDVEVDEEDHATVYVLDETDVRQFMGVLPQLPDVEWADGIIPVSSQSVHHLSLVSEQFGTVGYGHGCLIV
jgi:hypothetical protein